MSMIVKPIDLSKHWNLSPSGVLHVGAHMGEEKNIYDEVGWGPIIWIEAQPELANYLVEKFKNTSDRVICATVWDKDGIPLKLNIASNSGSSSLLELGKHKHSYPQISYVKDINVTTSRLDSILNQGDFPDFLNLDIQGVELKALQGLGDLINLLDYVYVEINTREVYVGCTKLDDLDTFLNKFGFSREVTRRYIRHGWGEALYIRRSAKQKNFVSLNSRILLALKFYIPQIKNFCRNLVSRVLHER